jgi:hypothetical protein
MAAGRRAWTRRRRTNWDARSGAEEARRCGEPIPYGGVSWETPRSSGDKDLRGTMAVNAGRASEKGRETTERSGGMKRLPGTRSRAQKNQGRPDDDGIIREHCRSERGIGDTADDWRASRAIPCSRRTRATRRSSWSARLDGGWTGAAGLGRPWRPWCSARFSL